MGSRPRHTLVLLAVMTIIGVAGGQAQPPETAPPAGDPVKEPAGEAQRPDPNKPQWALGLGLVQSAHSYREMDDELIPVPVVFLRWKRLAFEGIALSFRLTETERVRIRAVAKARFDGYDAEDSPFVESLTGRRDPARGGSSTPCDTKCSAHVPATPWGGPE